jgi:hypothetical protein
MEGCIEEGCAEREHALRWKVALLGGTALNLDGGINLLAFRADIGLCLGSKNLPRYRNIRTWVLVNGVLSVAALKTDGDGAALRWKDNFVNPHQYEKIADLNGEGATLVAHDGRLFVSTWPAGDPNTPSAELSMSLTILNGGVTPANPSVDGNQTAGFYKLYAATTEVPRPIGRGGQSTAKAVSLEGIGNCATFGFRTLLADDARCAGRASSRNLSTNTTGERPEGGPELISIKSKSQASRRPGITGSGSSPVKGQPLGPRSRAFRALDSAGG